MRFLRAPRVLLVVVAATFLAAAPASAGLGSLLKAVGKAGSAGAKASTATSKAAVGASKAAAGAKAAGGATAVGAGAGVAAHADDGARLGGAAAGHADDVPVGTAALDTAAYTDEGGRFGAVAGEESLAARSAKAAESESLAKDIAEGALDLGLDIAKDAASASAEAQPGTPAYEKLPDDAKDEIAKHQRRRLALAAILRVAIETKDRALSEQVKRIWAKEKARHASAFASLRVRG